MTSKDQTEMATAIIASNGNVYAHLGFEDPALELAKAVLAQSIARAIESRSLTQTRAAELAGLDQPKISAILRGRLGGFSLERLIRTLTALGEDIEIIVRSPNLGGTGHISVRLEPVAT